MSSSEKNTIGLHLRLEDTLEAVLNDADELALTALQFFVSRKTASKKSSYISVTGQHKELLEALVQKHGTRIFIHTSYWINAASGKDISYPVSKALLKKELSLANQLGIPYVVLHPGTANGFSSDIPHATIKTLGIQRIIDALDEALTDYPAISILLENTAHGKNAIGSLLEDLALIRQGVKFPDRVGFCLDTAHAFVYGYNVASYETFIAQAVETLGLDSIKLIHLNDSQNERGSKHDEHATPGQGLLGLDVLRKIAHFPLFSHIPKIIELAPAPVEILQEVLNSFNP